MLRVSHRNPGGPPPVSGFWELEQEGCQEPTLCVGPVTISNL